jgi:hypothetical protein
VHCRSQIREGASQPQNTDDSARVPEKANSSKRGVDGTVRHHRPFVRRTRSGLIGFRTGLWLISVAAVVGRSVLVRSQLRQQSADAMTAPARDAADTVAASSVFPRDSRASPQRGLVTPARGRETGRISKRRVAGWPPAGAAVAIVLSAASTLGVCVWLVVWGHGATATEAARSSARGPIPKAATSAPTTVAPASQARNHPAPQVTIARSGSGRSFAWGPAPNASGYAIEIIRNGEPIYSATTKLPRVRIPNHWRHHGRLMTLTPGSYRWYVWPILRDGTATGEAPALVASELTITR